MKRRRLILYLTLMLIFILAMWFLLDEKNLDFHRLMNVWKL